MSSPASLRQRLTEINREMLELHSRLAHLASARTQIVNALKSVVYPILTLPLEITSEIFTHFVERAHVDHPNPMAVPLILTGVCRAWRTISLNLPKLWSKIAFKAAFPLSTDAVNLLHRWLQRTDTHPLELNMILFSDPLSIFTTFAPYSKRWKSFACCLLPNTPPLHEIHCGLPHLQSLTLSDARDWPWENPSVATPITAFLEAPLLCGVHLTGVPAALISLPWTQLTTLRCENNLRECIKILQLTPNLVTLCLAVLYTDGAAAVGTPIPSVHLTQVHTLMLTTPRGRINLSGDILEFLTLPALQCLEMRENTFDSAVHRACDLIQRSKCSLLSLQLHRTEPEALINLIEHAPSVTKLVISKFSLPHHAEQLLMALTTLDRLPGLRELYIGVCPWTAAPGEHHGYLSCHCISRRLPFTAMVEFLEARALGSGRQLPNQVARLEKLRLSFTAEYDDKMHTPPDLEPAAAERLRAMISASEGCKIHISNPGGFDASSHARTHPNVLYSLGDLLLFDAPATT